MHLATDKMFNHTVNTLQKYGKYVIGHSRGKRIYMNTHIHKHTHTNIKYLSVITVTKTRYVYLTEINAILYCAMTKLNYVEFCSTCIITMHYIL